MVSVLKRSVCRHWAPLVTLAAIAVSGCCSSRPAEPLVPLPDSQMPTKADLNYKPWRVVVVSPSGHYQALEQAFVAELKRQLARYGIQNISSDARSNALITQMLRNQAQSGGEINVKDVSYEMANADGVLSVSVHSVTTPRRNAVNSWTDKKGVTHYSWTTEVVTAGSVSITIPKTGLSDTVQFSNNQIKTTYDKPHQFSVDQMAMNAAKAAARSGRVVRPLYTRFPLKGYIIGTGDKYKDIRINRGARHGVQRGRKWELLMESRQMNALLGTISQEEVAGSARTIEVYDNSCIARCDSGKTRDRAKLGMKVRAMGFGFSLSSLFGVQ